MVGSMKIALITAAAALFAGGVHAQTVPEAGTAPAAPSPVSSLTRDLNSGPPAPASYLAQVPAPVSADTPSVAPVATPTSPPATATPTTPRLAPAPTAATPPRTAVPGPVLPPAESFTPPRVAPAPRTAPSVPRPSPSPAVVPEPAMVPPPPATPAITVLDAAARAALPFRTALPPGFEIVTGRPGPDFRVYTIRRGERSFVMVYAGPASQFPIYSGQMIEAGGRASVVATEDGVRHAMEHLFQRPAAPREIHVWIMSLEGADRALAEQIAQSVDVR